MIKLYLYAVATVDDVDIKAKFISGLSPNDKKRVDKFWIEKRLNEIFAHLDEP